MAQPFIVHLRSRKSPDIYACTFQFVDNLVLPSSEESLVKSFNIYAFLSYMRVWRRQLNNDYSRPLSFRMSGLAKFIVHIQEV